MKLTKRQLKRIIKEEKAKLQEAMYADGESLLDLDDYNKLTQYVESLISKMMWTRNPTSNEQERTGYSRADVIRGLQEILGDLK